METELLRRYALALALVPDADVAGDLFMDAKDEHDLRRRALAWRRTQGFPELTEDPPLPALSADDQEYALHLARRGRKRRVLRRIGLAGAAVVVAALLLVGGRWFAIPGLAPAVPAWASDGLFAGKAAATATQNQVTLSVYRVDATPGKITVWWQATGAGTVKNWKSLRPVAALSGGAGDDGVQPESSETVLVNHEKVIGRSTYRLFTIGAADALVRLDNVGSRRVGAQVSVPISRADVDPEARTYKIPVPPGYQGDSLPESVAVGPNYVALTSSTYGQRVPDTRFPRMWAGDKPLRYLASERRSAGKHVDYYEAPPQGATSLHIQWEQELLKVDTYTLDLPGELREGLHAEQQGTDPVVVFSFSPVSTVGFGLPATAEDESGKRYDLEMLPRPPQQPGTPVSKFLLRAKDAPAGTRLVRVSFQRYQLVMAPQFDIDLTQQQ